MEDDPLLSDQMRDLVSATEAQTEATRELVSAIQAIKTSVEVNVPEQKFPTPPPPKITVEGARVDVHTAKELRCTVVERDRDGFVKEWLIKMK